MNGDQSLIERIAFYIDFILQNAMEQQEELLVVHAIELILENTTRERTGCVVFLTTFHSAFQDRWDATPSFIRQVF